MAQWVKNPPDNAKDTGLIPGSGRSPGEGNGNPLQYSCLGNPTGRGAWWATVHGVAKERDTTERLSDMCCILLGAFASDFSRFKNILFICLAVLVLVLSCGIFVGAHGTL